LSSLAFQNTAQQVESLHTALQSLGAAFETRDFDSLYRCTIGLARGDGTTASVVLSSANSQLHSLNTDAEEFKLGYEPDIAAVIDYFVGNDGSMVDVGANFGYFSIYLASREGFCGTVDAFEPSARGFNDFEKLVAGFELAERIRIHQCALGDSTGTVELFVSNSDGLTTMVPAMANRLEKVLSQRTVELRTLDDYPIGPIDLIKIDVEGAETLVITGGLEAIKAHSPVVVFESWATLDDSAAFTRLLNCGYRFFVPAWVNLQGEMTPSIGNAVDPTKLELVMFQATERKNLPKRINVVAIHTERVERLSRANRA
jgi:FkbM family methyltransferase